MKQVHYRPSGRGPCCFTFDGGVTDEQLEVMKRGDQQTTDIQRVTCRKGETMPENFHNLAIAARELADLFDDARGSMLTGTDVGAIDAAAMLGVAANQAEHLAKRAHNYAVECREIARDRAISEET